MLNSSIYVGQVRHRRLEPLLHQFRYSLYMVLLDLDELDELFRGRWIWSTRRFAPFSFRREDHLGPPEQPLKEAVMDLVEERIDKRPQGAVRILTNLRCWGYLMNPVSFYYCYDATNTHVEALVAEVNNTPWGERYCYVLDCSQSPTDTHQEVQPKVFHVSPFMEMNMQYHWTVTAPEDRLFVRIENYDNQHKLFEADLHLNRKPFTSWSLFCVGLEHPWMTAKVVAAIYWNALKLWWKGVKYVPHPNPKTG